MAYDKTNSGTIAKNTRKTQDNHPDITGSINVDGKDWWLSGWKKSNKSDGSTFYSLSVKPKEARHESGRKAPPSDFSDLDSDPIPF
jgi:hypothetical protein